MPEPSQDGLLIVRFDEVHVPLMRSAPASEPAVEPTVRAATGDLGFSRRHALTALAGLRERHGSVEGVEVLHVLGDRSDYVLQTWRCEPGIGESTLDFHARSVLLAEEFVDGYPDPGDGTVRYVLLRSSDPAPLERAA